MSNYIEELPPGERPVAFMPDLCPVDSLIHRGVFSPDLQEFYYVLSDRSFSRFDIYVIEQTRAGWTHPRLANFNSNYSDHGLSFSPDGKRMFFSSTRPVGIADIPDTWHLWESVLEEGQWSEPSFVDIPNMRDRLLSHPSCAPNGSLYFHASQLDYSGMDIYVSSFVEGQYKPAKKIEFLSNAYSGYCTPYIAHSGKYLFFAGIGESLDLLVSYRSSSGWSKPEKLPAVINQNGQGNPYLSPDESLLFYAVEAPGATDQWQINWVNTESWLHE
ncbi:MAG: hypothetical protein AAF433_21990 [Bacteroidota bacterium]